MPTAELTVQYKNDVKPGKKLGSIKSSEGQYYYASQPTLNNFQVGEVCTIEYSSTTDQNGKVWLRIQKKVSGAASMPSAVQPQVRAQTNPKEKKINFVMTMLGHTIMPTDSLQILRARGDQYKQLFEYLFGDEKKQTTEATLDDSIPDFEDGQ